MSTRLRPRLAALLTVAVLALVASPAVAAKAPRSTAGLPMDYTTLVPRLTQPVFPDIVRDTYLVPMHDGIRLYVEVVRPDVAGRRFPVIMEASPYHGTLADRDGTRILPEPRNADGRSIGLTGYFAPRGYAVVMVDLRGTGRSEGCLDHLGPDDAQDLKTIVEWAAHQSWSNGRVGMTGHSYVGSTPSVAAAQNPEGLATIVPSAGLASMYDHQFQAGVPYFLQWAGPQWAYEWLAMARFYPPIGNEPVQGANTGDNFGNGMQYFGCGWENTALISGEDQASGRYADWHAERDWSEGATASRIPVFLVHGVNDNAARIAAAQWFTERQALDPGDQIKDKLWLGQWDHGSGCCPTRRGIQWTYALHAWFDRHLARRSVPTGPPVEVFLGDGTFAEARAGARTEIYTARTWPGSPSVLELYASNDGGLWDRRPGNAGSVSFTGDARGFTDPFGTGGATFVTAPLTADMVLVGQPELDLVASVTAPRVHLIASLFDRYVNEQGTVVNRRITQFAINPELRNGIDTVTPVIPGQKYTMSPPGFAMGHHLREGHQLVLRVTTSDPDKAPVFAVDPRVTVFTGPGGTAVRVPTVPGAVLYPDTMPLTVEEGVPVGPAQGPSEGMVTTGAPGAGQRIDGVTSTFFEFESQDGFDNATAVIEAVPTTDADIDLYVQRRQADGAWSGDLWEGESGSLTEETVTTGRLQPGVYRVEVHNWAGAPGNQVSLTITFYNQNDEAGT
jgi:predicted acyl esterase